MYAPNFTTLRLYSPVTRESAGEWYASEVTPFHVRDLRIAREEEPHMKWRLETRGMSKDWHPIEPDPLA